MLFFREFCFSLKSDSVNVVFQTNRLHICQLTATSDGQNHLPTPFSEGLYAVGQTAV